MRKTTSTSIGDTSPGHVMIHSVVSKVQVHIVVMRSVTADVRVRYKGATRAAISDGAMEIDTFRD